MIFFLLAHNCLLEVKAHGKGSSSPLLVNFVLVFRVQKSLRVEASALDNSVGHGGVSL